MREGVTQDEWVGNTFTGINTYRKIDTAAGSDMEPGYDAKGLLKDDDQTNTVKGYAYTYDAWDRLVSVSGNNSGPLVAEYRYNGLGHRIGWHYDVNASGGAPDGSDPWCFFQHNERWQQVAAWKEGDADVGEVFTYGNAGMDGYGGSSYIDDVVCRERDSNTDGTFDDRYYYLQNWRNDVVAIMTHLGAVKERIVYDAYGRPSSFSPGDIYNGSNHTPAPPSAHGSFV